MKHKYLPKLISGEWISAIAMTEPGENITLRCRSLHCDCYLCLSHNMLSFQVLDLIFRA
jgi:hypothetical protein